MTEHPDPDDHPFILLFEKDDCKALWRRMDKEMLEFLLIKGDRLKICVIDVSNDYTRQQLNSLLDLIRGETETRLGPAVVDVRRQSGNEDISHLFEQALPQAKDKYEPIALPWYNASEISKMSRDKRMTFKRRYKEVFGEDLEYTCPDCFKRFKQKYNMLRHKEAKHDKEKIKFECRVCGKHYKHRQHYEDHVKSHDGYMHQCMSCLEGFPSRNSLRAHLKICGTGVESKKKKRNTGMQRFPGPPFPESTGKTKIPFDFRVVL